MRNTITSSGRAHLIIGVFFCRSCNCPQLQNLIIDLDIEAGDSFDYDDSTVSLIMRCAPSGPVRGAGGWSSTRTDSFSGGSCWHLVF